MVSRFVAEARAVNQIRHRNIIDIFSFGQLARRPPLLRDGAARRRAARRDARARGHAAVAEALPILRAIATRARRGARARASPTAISSRRTSSSRRTRTASVFPKLLDFGIAKLMTPRGGLEHKTRTGVADRHAVLHVARAVPRQGRRSPHRHLRVRRARVPDADRRVPVRRRRLHGRS